MCPNRGTPAQGWVELEVSPSHLSEAATTLRIKVVEARGVEPLSE